MNDLLLEIGTEELPAGFIAPAAEKLKEQLLTVLTDHRLPCGSAEVFGSPRRLAVIVADVADEQTALEEMIKGPPRAIAFDDAGNPTKAAEGFARSQGIPVAALVTQELDGAPYLFAKRQQPQASALDVLPELLPEVIKAMTFPKSMRWGSGTLRFARPIRWIAALLGEHVLSFCLDGVTSGRCTRGHRQLCPDSITLEFPRQYQQRLADGFVIADAAERQARIKEQLLSLAADHAGTVELDPDLLEEVTHLVEYPTAFCGRFDPDYLALPEAVLITTMRLHQKYFPVRSPQGTLLPLFAGIRNGSEHGLETVREGNERVLAARLADAAFFFQEDSRQSLDSHVDALRRVVFQEGLGSLYDKFERMQGLAQFCLSADPGLTVDAEHTTRAVRLAKADLVSQMVFELPELQGVMGGEYARRSGEAEEVASAIAEHYKPCFASDTPPSSALGGLVSLIDKIDTIVGYFGQKKIPTGSQDPFALRRQALGVLQVIFHHRFRLSLPQLTAKAISEYGRQGITLDPQTAEALLEFLRVRLRTMLLSSYQQDTIDAVLAAEQPLADVIETKQRTASLDTYRGRESFTQLMTAYERARHLAEKATDKTITEADLTPADQALYSALQSAEARFIPAMKEGDYEQALAELASLKDPLDAFFEAELVMHEDAVQRRNRLALLLRIAELFQAYALFQYIEIPG